jgi:hypothetical protein
MASLRTAAAAAADLCRVDAEQTIAARRKFTSVAPQQDPAGQARGASRAFLAHAGEHVTGGRIPPDRNGLKPLRADGKIGEKDAAILTAAA